jgi:hypothetical protein
MPDRMPIVRRLASLSLLGVLGVGLVAACKAPPPKPPPPVAVVAPPPPPPPPKTCDTLEDACTAAADTRSPIQSSGWSLAPPPEWTYAHETAALLARTQSASLGVTIHETGDKKTAAAKRVEALELVAHKLGLTAPKKKVVWPRKPAKVLPVGDVKIALYQFSGFTQEQKPGALLVFTSKLSDTQSLLGVGFVLESDTHDADKAVLTSVESLRSPDQAQAQAHDAGAPR